MDDNTYMLHIYVVNPPYGHVSIMATFFWPKENLSQSFFFYLKKPL